MNQFLTHIGKMLSQHAANLCKLSFKRTVSGRDIQTAVRLAIPGELAKHSVSEGTKAVTKYTSSLNFNFDKKKA